MDILTLQDKTQKMYVVGNINTYKNPI